MSDPSHTGANPLTPADDLPPLTIPGPHATTLDWSEYWRIKYQRTEATRAERDADLEHANKWRAQAVDRIRDLSREIVERDAEIERLTTELKRAVEHGIRLLEQLAQRDAEVERLKAEGQLDYDGMREFQARYIAADQRAEAAEARVYLTPEAMESMTAVMKIGAEYAEEAKTLRTRVAELEEKLMVMCVAQINGAEITQEPVAFFRTLNGAIDWSEDCCATRPDDLQLDSYIDHAHPDEHYAAMPVYAAKESRPAPDPPDPVPVAAQGVEGEPQHER